MAEIPKRLLLRVWSDVLCPWCYNAAVTLDRIEKESDGFVEVRWYRYLLRTERKEKSLERFIDYTQSWMRPAAAEGAARFRVWSTQETPPSHSVPANVAVRAAEHQRRDSRFHLALMDAYFYDNRNVTDVAVIEDVVASCDLDLDRFRNDFADPAVEQEVWADHREAIKRGISSVPTLVVGKDFHLPGAQSEAFYLNLVVRAREGKLSS
jgi:predicted DsbA family dithiol-disulfide isomerase